MLDADMCRVIAEQRLGFVATVCADGTPNLSPKGTLAVWDAAHLVFAHLHSPQTVANIEAGRTTVDINVVDPFARKGYRFKGSAAVHRSGPVFDDGRRFYQQRTGLAPDRVHAIVLIQVGQVTAMRSPAYDDGSTEHEITLRSFAQYGVHPSHPSQPSGD